MIDYNILDVGLWCEGKDFEEAELCYDIIREDFFDDIGGGELFEEASSSKSAQLKQTIKNNKKKIAIIAACSVALIAAVVILKKKGKTKEAAQAKKAGEHFKSVASTLKNQNTQVESAAKSVIQEEKKASTPEQKKAAAKKVEKVLEKAEAVNAKAEKTAEVAKEKKEKFYAPAVVTQTSKAMDDLEGLDRKYGKAIERGRYYRSSYIKVFNEIEKKRSKLLDKIYKRAERENWDPKVRRKAINRISDELNKELVSKIGSGNIRDLNDAEKFEYKTRWSNKKNLDDFNYSRAVYDRAVDASNKKARGERVTPVPKRRVTDSPKVIHL